MHTNQTVATVLTVYGIETNANEYNRIRIVATVLTVYGIETSEFQIQLTQEEYGCNSTYRLRY